MGIRTQVDIDPAALGITWAPNTQYRIAIEEGFMIENGAEGQPNPAVPSLLSFTTNATGPVLSSSSPSSGATGIIGVSKVTLTYDRKVIKNAGSIKFYKVGSPATLIQTLNVAESDVYLESDTTQLSFNLVDAIQDPTSTYYFTIDANAVKDYDNFLSPAITDTSIIRFTTGAAPAIVSTNPADNATGITNATISITFDRNVKKGTGYIEIYKTSDDSLAHSINVSDSRVTVSNATVSIDTTFLLDSDTGYYVKVTQYAIRDIAGMYFGGISNKTTFNFTTATGGQPGYSIYLPAQQTFLILYPAATRPRATTAQSVDNTAGIKLWQKNSGTADTLINSFYDNGGTQSDDSDDIIRSSSVSYIGVRLAGFIQYNKEYYLTIDTGAFYDFTTGLTLPGISTQLADLTFDTKTVFTNQAALTYVGNINNDYFPTAQPTNIYGELPDTWRELNVLINSGDHTIEFTSNIGKWATTAGATPTTTATISQYAASRPNNLNNGTYFSDVKFYPDKNATTNGTYTITLKQGSTTILSNTFAMNYSGTTNNTAEIVELYSAGSGTWTPTPAQVYYRPNATVLLVGGGGGGTAIDSSSPFGQAGGGGGGVLEQSGITITQTGYAYTVGAGGGVATAGGNTTMFSYTANGGSAPTGSNTTVVGGTSGAPTAQIGGGPGTAAPNYGGGGGGAGQVGWTLGTSGTGYYQPLTSVFIANGIDSTVLGALGEAKLGAGGPWPANAVGWLNLNWVYPVNAGNGASGDIYSPSTKIRTTGANGIIAIKLSV